MNLGRLGAISAILLCITLCACTAPPAVNASPAGTAGTSGESTSARLLTQARTFAFRVRNTSCLATGSSFATKEGIVTNRHVAIGSNSLQLSTWSGNDFSEPVLAISEQPGPDLAVLPGGGGKGVAPLDSSYVAPGTEVWAAGYPEGDQLALTDGIIIDYTSGAPYGEPGQVMELTNAVKPGNSGSPLLNGQGEVVGVVFALNTVTGNGVAIPTATLESFLESPGSDTSGQCAA